MLTIFTRSHPDHVASTQPLRKNFFTVAFQLPSPNQVKRNQALLHSCRMLWLILVIQHRNDTDKQRNERCLIETYRPRKCRGPHEPCNRFVGYERPCSWSESGNKREKETRNNVYSNILIGGFDMVLLHYHFHSLFLCLVYTAHEVLPHPLISKHCYTPPHLHVILDLYTLKRTRKRSRWYIMCSHCGFICLYAGICWGILWVLNGTKIICTVCIAS